MSGNYRTIEEIRKKMEDRNLTKIAAAVGLEPNTVYNVANGKAKSMSFTTYQKLVDYLFQEN